MRILGTACGLAIEGSGWVAAPDLVVTNAHVIAGESDTTVQVAGHSPSLPARPVAFDPTDDIAVLSVPELGLPTLSLASATRRPGAAARSSATRRTGRSTCVRRASDARRSCSPTMPTAAGRCGDC